MSNNPTLADYVTGCETWRDVGEKARGDDRTFHYYPLNTEEPDRFKVIVTGRDYWVIRILPDCEGLRILPDQALLPTGSSIFYGFEPFRGE